MPEVKKIVVLGPESTGKSTLCGQLAAHYKTIWCPEFAREYLQDSKSYTYNDLLGIAKGQLDLEDECVKKVLQTPNSQSELQNQQILFIDTNMIVMQVWCEFVFGKCHQFIIDEIVERKYDLYLLCNIDLPWVEDKLREYPDIKTREELYYIYKDIMVNQQVPWVDVFGNNEERKNVAIKAIDKFLGSQLGEPASI